MQDLAKHEMRLERTHGTGAEEWYCPTCGRRFVMDRVDGCELLAMERGAKHVLVWGSQIGTTAATKIVLELGDEAAMHTGAKGKFPAAAISALPVEAEDAGPLPWPEWVEHIDFGDGDTLDSDTLA